MHQTFLFVSFHFISVLLLFLGLGKLWSDSRNKKIIRFHILDRNVITMNRTRQWPKHERDNNYRQQQNQQQHKKCIQIHTVQLSSHTSIFFIVAVVKNSRCNIPAIKTPIISSSLSTLIAIPFTTL